MTLSWNEIRNNAREFAHDWKDESSERAEAKTFWDAFFQIFGVTRRRIASFEEPVKRPDGSSGSIDLLWKGKLVVEHKSRGKSLDKAYDQALDYFPGLKDADLPRYVLVSDFARFRLYDLEEGEHYEFTLSQLYRNVNLFGFIAGYESRSFGEQDPVNIKAAAKLGDLHDLLDAAGYTGHELEVFLVRVLFCAFAEDTGIFEPRLFTTFIEQHTEKDGSDVGLKLNTLFQVLDRPVGSPKRKGYTTAFTAFPYINGKLFSEVFANPPSNRAMRETLLECCSLDWSRISPAIFGSLFQSIMDKDKRRNLGAHYTSEINILKALEPLFLDQLRDELAACGHNKRKLQEFQQKLSEIRIFDPACGCGNFLVIAYRELRRLELQAIEKMRVRKDAFLIEQFIHVNVDQFYGIEFEEFPAQIAQVALWLTDHQMNIEASDQLGQTFVRLPLKKAATIVHGNALELDWAGIIKPTKLSYIVGNPPFVGARMVKGRLREEMDRIFEGESSAGLLDYVCCWYLLAARYMQTNPAIRAALVSTNSITQGEQPGVLWPVLYRAKVRINFAHRTFQWTSEASGKAAVHCVIVGFALEDETIKTIYDYEDIKGDAVAVAASNINPYLVDAPNITLQRRSHPLCEAPKLGIGNKPIDDGNYLFTDEEKAAFLQVEPQAEPFFKPWIGSEEFINGISRWCLWLGDCPPSALKGMPESRKRIAAVREFRLKSKSAPTRKIAESPARFHVENMPDNSFVVIPKTSSERRRFIPIGYLEPDTICGDAVFIGTGVSDYHFGVLTSTMHMAWVRGVGGRLESRYRYSVTITYNNFPWPKKPNDKQVAAIEEAAQAVLDARKLYPKETLANLYDPDLMPKELRAAHRKLDKAVDRAYGAKAFASEAQRLAFLFQRYLEASGNSLWVL